MTSDTIFFSYSRDDSDFVLNLAKELRNAGAKIWLDQLDIKPGSRWDSSIEEALSSSKILLVILSKSSVGSNNVMDEVSYALEERKLVVPVLLEECDIPFRLKRLQYANFTGDHGVGIKNLIDSLNLEANVASKLSESAKEEDKKQEPKPETVVPPVVQKKEEPTPKVVQSQSIPRKKSKSKSPFIIISIVAVVLLLAFFVVIPAMSDTEGNDNIINTENEPLTLENNETNSNFKEDWKMVKDSKSIEDFITFGMIYSEEDGFDYMEYVSNPIDNLLPYNATVIFMDPDGARLFNNAYSLSENGDLHWIDDGENAGYGNLLKAKMELDLFDITTKQYLGKTIYKNQIVQVLNVGELTQDGYIFIDITYNE